MISGETLRLLRMFKGIKQEAIAKGLGISQPAYSKLESSCSITDIKLEHLLAALGCTTEELTFFLKITPPPENDLNYLVADN